jgi:hypothetical protein
MMNAITAYAQFHEALRPSKMSILQRAVTATAGFVFGDARALNGGATEFVASAS